jgi:NADH-quinone oxidoreductase subunit N
LLNSGLAAAYYLRLAFTAAQRPDEDAGQDRSAVMPIGIAVGAALLFTVGATLALGIVPGNILHASDTGHTLQAPPPAAVPAEITAKQAAR